MNTSPFVSGSDTSAAAAASITPSAAQAMRDTILASVTASASVGLTCDEVEELHNMRHQTASARIKELKDEGLLLDSGRRRDTRSGRKAAVLVAAA